MRSFHKYLIRLSENVRNTISLLFFVVCGFQECSTYHRVDDICYKRSETYIGQKMISHVHSVVAVKCHKYAGYTEAYKVLRHALFPAHIGKHGQREHHRRNRHITTWPALEVIVASREIWYHLPPACDIHL